MIFIRSAYSAEQNTHPKAIEAERRARVKQAEIAADRLAKKKIVESIATEHGLRFIDITPAPSRYTQGMTVAFNGNKVLRVSLVTRNPADAYSKLEGRLAAAKSFKDGRYIHLRRPKGFTAVEFLRDVFSF